MGHADPAVTDQDHALLVEVRERLDRGFILDYMLGGDLADRVRAATSREGDGEHNG